MVYRVIGAMSGSSMDGLDLAYCVLSEIGGEWSCEIEGAESMPFTNDWKKRLATLTDCSAKELLQTHTDFGHYLGQQMQLFIQKYTLEHKVHFVASHGHTVFHEPEQQMTFQIGDGASIAAELELPVISDLRNMDVAFGGQGAPHCAHCRKKALEWVRLLFEFGRDCQHRFSYGRYNSCL